MSARTILIGDVHGCADELGALLDAVSHTPADRVVLVGDLVARGPDVPGVIARCIEIGALAVRGNHEERWLALRGVRELPDRARQALQQLDLAAWRYLEAMPLTIDLPEHDALVVHAGLVPGVPLAQQEARTMLSVRTLGPAGEPSALREGGEPWGAAWGGPRHVVFGHNASREPQLHRTATGLDTSCVYGGRLTALVLAVGERVPEASKRAEALVSVPARRAYAPIG